MVAIYQENGIRFEYPVGWELEVTDDGDRTTVAVQSPSGSAFALVTVDVGRPEPDELADEALEAMRDEYPALDAVAASETIDGHAAIGHDLQFFCLDMITSCSIRCFRTPRRTVLLFGQWSDLDDEETEWRIASIGRTLEETDA